jgi:hypothetical protein
MAGGGNQMHKCENQTAHGAVSGASRTGNAAPECTALKTTRVVGAPRHDRVRAGDPSAESLYALDL